jgi:hypothetical protein
MVTLVILHCIYTGNKFAGFIPDYWVVVAGSGNGKRVVIYGIDTYENSIKIIDGMMTPSYQDLGGIAAIIPNVKYISLKIEIYYDVDNMYKKTFIIPRPINNNSCFMNTYNATSITDFDKFKTITNCFIIDSTSASVYCDTPLTMVPTAVFSNQIKKVGIKNNNFYIKEFVNMRTVRNFSKGMVNIL